MRRNRRIQREASIGEPRQPMDGYSWPWTPAPVGLSNVHCQSTPSIDVRIVPTKPTRCGKRVHSRRAKSCKHVQSSLTHALYVQCHLDACTCALPYLRTCTEAAVRRVVPHSTTRQCGSVHYNVATQHVIPRVPSKLAHGALADNM